MSEAGTSEVEQASDGPVPLLEPADGVPPVIDTADAVAEAAAELAAGTGPLAVDAERASGFRYSNRAYLIQLRRAGSGSFLVDPIPVAGDLAPLAEAINPLEWVLHSADQDLPGLDELGLRPAALYDTELAGRLAGFERVGLAAIVERTLGLELRKGHGAADWSTRPLPDTWLNYAALDVEVLLELREKMVEELAATGKTDWAAEEFEYIRTAGPPKPKAERWRRTSQIHTLKKARQLATVRQLWLARDELASRKDIAPGRVLPDSAIVAAASADPKSVDQLRKVPVFGGPRQRRMSRVWLDAIDEARALPDNELPPVNQQITGPPPINRWSRRNPEAAQRLTAARAAMAALSDEVSVPVENILLPDLLRRLVWDGIEWDELLATPDMLVPAIDDYLAAGNARVWQRTLTVHRLAEAILTAPAVAEEPATD
ncbi:HRDC domain-containing protein [Antrihabitans cavernicola]|uniref:Ribonuclease D n=1 Tax=Antrihabitans cavernicola TaxID=2495913 RepID=A0A5A7SBA7_9NOCA|nr:ribonuclease D [Spelaeibacter cavernicola]KAA0023418.1 ribonuclease D [Spelaeibacter cavernicola]